MKELLKTDLEDTKIGYVLTMLFITNIGIVIFFMLLIDIFIFHLYF